MDSKLSTEERSKLIDQLVESFDAMPRWAKIATKHALGAPRINPKTNEPFQTFREVIEVSKDHTLVSLRDDFKSNGDLLPMKS